MSQVILASALSEYINAMSCCMHNTINVQHYFLLSIESYRQLQPRSSKNSLLRECLTSKNCAINLTHSPRSVHELLPAQFCGARSVALCVDRKHQIWAPRGAFGERALLAGVALSNMAIELLRLALSEREKVKSVGQPYCNLLLSNI